MDKAKILKQLEKHIVEYSEEDDTLYNVSAKMIQNYELHRIADALEELVKVMPTLGD